MDRAPAGPVAMSNTKSASINQGMKQRPAQPWAHLLAGASGGLATSILTSPLDVLRTRLQSDLYRRPHSSGLKAVPKTSYLPGTIQIIRSIYHTEGWRAFFRGLGPSLSGVVPATAVKFYVYGNAKRLGAQVFNVTEDTPAIHVQAAIAAGIATATATNPIWLIKTRLQLDASRSESAGQVRQYRNSVDCTRKVLQQEGVRGLYRGLSASYLGTAETVFHLVLYEQFKSVYYRTFAPSIRTNTIWNEARYWIGTSGAAGTAKFAAVLITYPHEVLRTRLRQAPMENGVLKYNGLLQCFQTIRAEEGLAGLYGGFTPHLLRSIPSAMITLGVYEFVLRLVGHHA